MLCTNCANAQNIPNREGSNTDLSTDAAVIAELQKMKDAEIAEAPKGDEKLEAKRRAASRLEARDICIERFKESPRVIVIGAFRYDYGCHFEGVFIDSRFYERTKRELHRNALAAFGWEKANRTERENLARLWVERGLLAFFTVLQTKPKELGNYDFRPPYASTTEKGEIKVLLWVQLPSRMSREKGFQHFEYTFDEDGNFSGSSTLDNVIAN